MSLSTLNPVEPPWYVTRMPGGVGGVAPRGVPLSRSSTQRRPSPPALIPIRPTRCARPKAVLAQNGVPVGSEAADATLPELWVDFGHMLWNVQPIDLVEASGRSQSLEFCSVSGGLRAHSLVGLIGLYGSSYRIRNRGAC